MANTVVTSKSNLFPKGGLVILTDLNTHKPLCGFIRLSHVLTSTIFYTLRSSSNVEIGSMALNFKGKNLQIIHLDNSKDGQITHVGKELVETARQIARTLKKPISLFATKNSHAFYWKCGFRSFSREANQKIELAIEEGKKAKRRANTEELGGLLMHLAKP